MRTYTTARWFTCPRHPDRQAVIPDGSDLRPACPACQAAMEPSAAVLAGAWKLRECCTPAGPGGTWAGPPRDARRCCLCFGTKRSVVCTVCGVAGCGGVHDFCLDCLGEGWQGCPRCEGEGVLYGSPGQDGIDEGTSCPRCRRSGEIPCPACQPPAS